MTEELQNPGSIASQSNKESNNNEGTQLQSFSEQNPHPPQEETPQSRLIILQLRQLRKKMKKTGQLRISKTEQLD